MALCSLCDKSFTQTGVLRRHLREVHGHYETKHECGVPKMKCAACSECFSTNATFIDHITQEHDFTAVTEEISFRNKQEFISWKRDLEEKHQIRFRVRTSKNGLDAKFVYYRCNRSGPVQLKVTEENRKREPKMGISCKTNVHCPAMITAKFSSNIVEVSFCKSHFGHEVELRHLPLPSPEKKSIASKIASKVPFDEILESVQASATKENVKRVHLLTKQDLRNIVSEFSLDYDKVHHSDDALSVDAWVEKEKAKGEESSILFYKPKGVDSVEYPQIKTDQFLLGIMTVGQERQMKLYGNDVVCLDSTHGTNAYGYLLTTLLVLNSSRQGFPCAYYISDKNDQEGLQIFFEKIKEKVGIFSPKVLMSDMADEFYLAWKAVMGDCEKRLYCTWHVLRAWQNRIHRDINAKEMKKEVALKLRTLLTQTDVAAFDRMLPVIIKRLLDDEETRDFGKYFEEYYSKNCERWAYCHRLFAGVNTNMHLESFHGELKHFYLGGKVARRLDATLHALMRITNRKNFNRFIALKKQQICPKTRMLRARHKRSLRMNINKVLAVNEHSWQVASTDEDDMYTVSVLNSTRPCSPKCTVICSHCQACFHNFICDCIDACVKTNMCKHIHLVCKFLATKMKAVAINEPCTSNALTIHEETEDPECTAIVESLPEKNEPKKTLQDSKTVIIDQMIDIIRNCKSEEELDVLRKLIKNAEPTIQAIRKIDITFRSPKKVDVRKKIDPQRKFRLLKKRVKHDKPERAKPTKRDVKRIIAETLLSSSR